MRNTALWVLTSICLAAGVAGAEVTYSKEVSRILQTRCGQCHRPGDIGPMSLQTYDDAVNYAPDIKRVVEAGIMPPWKPVQNHGFFRNSFALKPEEKTDLLAWIANGTPRGDEADLPPAAEAKGQWVLGEPDLTLKMPASFTPERGKDIYRCFVLPTGLDADKFVSAVDILPGNRAVVHHVILYLDSTGDAEKLDAKDEAPGYDCYGGPGFDLDFTSILQLLQNGFALGGWAPGTRPDFLPQGIGMKLGRSAKIVMQVHYYTNQRTGEDQTSLGLYFNKERVEKEMYWLPVVQPRLNIPAGNPAATATVDFTIPPFLDLKIINAFPHMHLLGTRIELDRIHRGDRENLILIDKWDFNWQGPYSYERQVAMPMGSTLRLKCTYDNSINNPRNPSNPLKDVKWGEGTEDEMCLALLGVTFDRF
jgi:mono/diheme cytochrome c family protein